MDTEKKGLKILITGVHNTPALAVLQELKKEGYSNFLWVGQRKSMVGAGSESIEFELAKKEGIPFQNIFAGKLRKGFSLVSLLWWLRIPVGFIQAFYILLKFRPNIIVTFGSHVGVPITVIGKLLGKKVLHHQQPIIIGTSDQTIQKRADIACYSWKASEKYFPKGWSETKYKFTGNPVREGILNPNANKYEFAEDRFTIMIVGGNQGAHVINEAVFGCVKKLVEKYNVIHQTGKSTVTDDFEKAQVFENTLNENGTRYITRDYIQENEMGQALRQADLLISRAGANACYEFALLEKPCILIPIPWAIRDEQRINATELAKTGLASVLEQADLNSERLLARIEERIVSGTDDKVKKAARALVKENASAYIVKEIERLLGK